MQDFLFLGAACFCCLLLVSVLLRKFLVRSPASIPLSPKNKNSEADYDIIIVGAGVIGGALGATLAKQFKNLRILMIEQSWKEPQRIVGELLQPGGVNQLHALGIPESLLNIDAQEVSGYGIFSCKSQFKLDYPQGERGRSFHNGRFIMNLRKLALDNPKTTAIEGVVKKLVYNNGRVVGVEYSGKDGRMQLAHASLTVVCDGCFSLLRNGLTQANYVVRSKFLGLVLEDVALPYPNMGHVVLADPTPILCYPISSTESRMLIDFPTNVPDANTGELQKYLLSHVLPQLPNQFRGPFKKAVKGKKEGKKPVFMSMPNRSLAAAPVFVPGTLLIGDALQMRHPLTGGGMTVGLTDVNSFVQNLAQVQGSDPKSLDQAVASFYRNRGESAPINILADALYAVFSRESVDLRPACYGYLAKGGWYAHGPISLLSGLSRSQLLLITHFFAVAIYGVGRELLPFPTPKGLINGIQILRRAVKIIVPLLENENRRQFGWAVRLFGYSLRLAFWV